MKMKNGIWRNEEVKSLFEEVEKIKNKNQSLKFAFIAHGEKYQRKPNSVRNYYYHEVDNLKKDKKRLKELKIDLSKHEKNEIKYFSQEEECNLMKEIDKLVKCGVSVRKACMQLSNGDIDLMLRFQNKYRNFISKQKTKETFGNNIIRFRKRAPLSEGEMQALFMGIVRLVKKNALDEAKVLYQRDIERANLELKKTFAMMAEKDRQICNLKDEFSKIKEENVKLTDDVMKLRSDKAEKLRERLTVEKLKRKTL